MGRVHGGQHGAGLWTAGRIHGGPRPLLLLSRLVHQVHGAVATGLGCSSLSTALLPMVSSLSCALWLLGGAATVVGGIMGVTASI